MFSHLPPTRSTSYIATSKPMSSESRVLNITNISIDQHLQVAEKVFFAGQMQQAEAMFKHALSAAPNHPQALRGLGLIAAQKGDAEEALRLIRQAVALHPTYAE